MIAHTHVPHRRAPISIVKDNLVSAVGKRLHHVAAVPAVWISRPPRIHARTGAKPTVLPLWLHYRTGTPASPQPPLSLLLLHAHTGPYSHARDHLQCCL